MVTYEETETSTKPAVYTFEVNLARVARPKEVRVERNVVATHFRPHSAFASPKCRLNRSNRHFAAVIPIRLHHLRSSSLESSNSQLFPEYLRAQ